MSGTLQYISCTTVKSCTYQGTGGFTYLDIDYRNRLCSDRVSVPGAGRLQTTVVSKHAVSCFFSTSGPDRGFRPKMFPEIHLLIGVLFGN